MLFIARLTRLPLSLVVVLVLLVLASVAAFVTVWLTPPPVCPIGTGGDLACARGFEAREHSGHAPFRWSNANAALHFAGLGYGPPVVATLSLQSGRPAGTAPVPARVGLNGHTLAALDVPPVRRTYRLLLPPQPLAGDLARVQLHSATWKPGQYSERTLGLILFRASATPTQGTRWPGAVLVLAWLALLLAAWLCCTHNGHRPWGVALPLLLLLPLCRVTPLVVYLPWLAVLVGGGVLLWRRAGHTHTPALHRAVLPLLPSLPYALVITDVSPAWARLPLLLASGGLAAWAAFVWTHRNDIRHAGHSLLTLVLAAGGVRLVLVGVRLLTGHTWLDADGDLFYSYGMALRDIGLPEVEYPTGALLVWAALTFIAGDSREAFALLLPLLNTVCDMAIVAALMFPGWLNGQHATSNNVSGQLRGAQVAAMCAAFYAFSPLLEPFVFAKYDALPAALAVGGLALFAAGRAGTAGASGAALGLGTTIKWTPLLSVPFLGLHLLRQRRWRDTAWFAALVLAAIAVCSVPFAWSRLDTFLLPYRLQGERGMNGESIWLLVALLRDPGMLADVGAPWGAVRRGALPVGLMTGVQVGGLVLLGVGALRWRPALWRTLALAAVAPVWFLLVNRIFSPQYLLPISAGLLAALAVTTRRTRTLTVALSLLALAQVSNLLVWPFFVPGGWVVASGVLFGSLLVVCGGIVWGAGRGARTIHARTHTHNR